jgi:hypothetical protein
VGLRTSISSKLKFSGLKVFIANAAKEGLWIIEVSM